MFVCKKQSKKLLDIAQVYSDVPIQITIFPSSVIGFILGFFLHCYICRGLFLIVHIYIYIHVSISMFVVLFFIYTIKNSHTTNLQRSSFNSSKLIILTKICLRRISKTVNFPEKLGSILITEQYGKLIVTGKKSKSNKILFVLVLPRRHLLMTKLSRRFCERKRKAKTIGIYFRSSFFC